MAEILASGVHKNKVIKLESSALEAVCSLIEKGNGHVSLSQM